MPELQQVLDDVQELLRADRLCLWHSEVDTLAVPIRSFPRGWIDAPVVRPLTSEDAAFSDEPAAALALLPLSARTQLQGQRVAGALSARRRLDGQRSVGLFALWERAQDIPEEVRRVAHDILGTVGRLIWELGTGLHRFDNTLQMHALASALPQSIVIVPVDGQAGYVNGTAAVLLDLPAGQTPPELLAAGLRRLVQRALNSEEVVAFAARVLGNNGIAPQQRTAVWRFATAPQALRVTISPVRAEAPIAWVWLLDDVSRETELQDELSANEQKFRHFYQSLRDTVVFYDLTGRPIECNQSLYQLLGSGSNDVTTLTSADLGWDATSWSDVAADCLIQGIARPPERKLRTAAGLTMHVESTVYLRRDAAGQPEGLWEVLHDITERKNAEAQLILSAKAFARHTEGVLLTDADMVILTANDAFTRTSGYSREELRGQRPSLLKSGKHDERFYTQMRHAIAEHGWWQGGIWNRHKNGELFFKWLTVNTVRDADGTLTHYIGTYREAIAVRAAQRHIEYMATHDHATQLPNAILFEDRIQFTLQRLKNSARMLGVVVLEVEGLQRISNAAGVAVGDQVLKDVVERLRAESRDCLAVARLSKEQFGTLLEVDTLSALVQYCQRLRQALNAPYVQAGRHIAAPVAIGISTHPSDGEDAPTLLLKAHAALNRAKTLETQGYQFFGAEMERQITEDFEIENGLRQALSRNELFLEYQAQVSSADGTVGGCEALIRWRRGTTTVAPGVFIPVAETSNLIVPITEWVLRQACRDLRAWDAHGVRIPTVSVNISARHFQLDTMVPSLIGIVRDEGVEPARICLEITEGALAEPEQSEAKLLALRQAGFALSVDDFGTGFSSLSYLKRFELDELKIDRSFINGIEGDHGDRALVNAILSIAQGLGLTTVAEGVENEAQLRYLAERGCALIQGYLFMRPSDAGTVENFARNRHEANQDGSRPTGP